MDTITLNVSTAMTPVTCPGCAGTFALLKAFMDEAREKGHFKKCWTCPYCKQERGYGESAHEKELARLRGVAEAAERNQKYAQDQRDRALAEAEHFRKSRDGMRGALVSTQRRVKNGVCPCCKRSFACLAAHMKTKHPGFAMPGAEPNS